MFLDSYGLHCHIIHCRRNALITRIFCSAQHAPQAQSKAQAQQQEWEDHSNRTETDDRLDGRYKARRVSGREGIEKSVECETFCLSGCEGARPIQLCPKRSHEEPNHPYRQNIVRPSPAFFYLELSSKTWFVGYCSRHFSTISVSFSFAFRLDFGIGGIGGRHPKVCFLLPGLEH